MSVVEVARNWNAAKNRVKENNANTAASHSRLLYALEFLRVSNFGSVPKLALEIEQIYWATFFNSMTPRPGAEEFLLHLRNRGTKVILISDQQTSIQIKKLIYFGWSNLFDNLITSELVGSEKITGRPFEYALNVLSESDKECVWFVGDEEWDVLPVTGFLESDRIRDGYGFLYKGKIAHDRIVPYKKFSRLQSLIP
jgi:FMN phosphatase YigB (HAD superfamily)